MTERGFWNKKYADGGISGFGSIGRYRKWKWKKINYIVGRIDYKSIVDVGCGDMTFWKRDFRDGLRKCKEYVGIDISEVIQERNKLKYPDRVFLTGNAKLPFVNVSGDIVLAMDLLFHIMNADDFIDILCRLCEYSKDWIIIYNWMNNPFAHEGLTTDGISQYYRNLKDYDGLFRNNQLNLSSVMSSPFDEYGCLYFYKKVDKIC